MTYTTTNNKQILFIDAGVADIQSILASLQSSIDYFLLDAHQDGLQQMADILAGYSNLDAIHVISHGAPGTLQLGNIWLTQATLHDHSTALSSIGSALTETGDLLLYGCDVAQGDVGQAFIQQLAGATGADVAASEDLTRATTRGGDWILESTISTIEVPTFTPIDAPVVLAIDNYDLNDGKIWSVMADCALAAYGYAATFRDALIDSPSWENIDFSTNPAAGIYDLATGRYKNSDISANVGGFVIRSGNTAVISFAGTTEWQDWMNDFLGMFPQISLLVPLIDAFDQFVANNGITQVYVTGHSLGGALAQAYMMAHPNADGVAYEAITFAAPGFNFGTDFGTISKIVADIPSTSKMAQMPIIFGGFDHRALHFEIDGDLVPDLLLKIGDTIHLHAQGIEWIEAIAKHNMQLYQKAVHLLDQEFPNEAVIPPDPPLSTNVLFGALFTGTEYFVGGTNDTLKDNDLAFTFEYILGGAGEDVLVGKGANQMYGGSGQDTLVAIDGNDILQGGIDSDTYDVSRVSNTLGAVPTYDITDDGGSNDVLIIRDLPGPHLISAFDAFNELIFKIVGNDLYISLDLDLDVGDEGRIVIHRQGIESNRIESNHY